MSQRAGNALVLAASLTMVFAASAHEGDPKIRDRQPAYTGPGWTKDANHGEPPARAFTASGVELLAWLPVTQFGAQNDSANSCWGYVSPGGHEYAIIGLSDGTGFVRVTNPGSPQIAGFIAGPESLWRDVKVHGQYCYAVSEGGSGIQVISMANIDSNSVSLVRTVTTGGTTATHTLAVNNDTGYLYRAGGGSSAGLRIYNLNSDPSNPQYVGQWTDRYVHEAQIVKYTSGTYAGKEIAFLYSDNTSGGGQASIDVVEVNVGGVPGTVSNISRKIYTGGQFSHQGWLSADKRYIYLDDELDEGNTVSLTTTLVFDAQNLSSLVQLPAFTNTSTAIGHNLYVKGNWIYEANYTSGLRIFDATNPTAPVEIAYFDTDAATDAPTFNRLWNNYPFLPSGIVIGSDIEQGLFVWRVTYGALDFDYPNGRPDTISPAGQTLRVLVAAGSGHTLDDASPTLFYDAGAGFVAAPMTQVSAGVYDAEFPALPCGTVVNYYVSAETTGGIVNTDPGNAPTGFYSTTVATSVTPVFDDNFGTNKGWTITNTSVTDGAWVRGSPLTGNNGGRGDPADDYDGNNAAYVTGNNVDQDLDGGPTRLVSPTFILDSNLTYVVSYARWFTNDDADADRLTVEVSNNNGTSWVQVENVGGASGWVFHSFSLNDYVAPSAQVKLRFSATDNPNNSVTEAALDAFAITAIECDSGYPLGDMNCDGSVNGFDIDGFTLALTDPAGYASTYPDCDINLGDTNSDGSVNGFDIDEFVAILGGG
ncbi:MAG: hypothetical protein CHACPFDD_00137 [Phycisphaerae bacterium]|nr:hypothetical protein [Phycisphaerae bacterium]